jgi:YbbR domain-containing protein
MRLRPRYPWQFVIALVAACLLWYGLAGQRRENISVRGVKATLTLVNLPRDLVVMSSVPDTVNVQLRGPLSRSLDPGAPLEVLLDLSDARPGIHSYSIEEEHLQLPPEVSVVSVDPAEITLELERLETASVPVRPTLEGEPAAGFVLREIRVTPSQITVQGPGSRLAALDHVATTPLSIEGATGSFEASLQPRLPDPTLRSLAVVPLLAVVDIGPATTPVAEATPSRQRR